jgi:hemoglobin-like flavoprotein
MHSDGKRCGFPPQHAEAAIHHERRHADYGVQVSHYATVGTALLWALRQALDPQCTPAVEAAWAAAYTLLVDTMQAAAAESAYGAEATQTAISAEG